MNLLIKKVRFVNFKLAFSLAEVLVVLAILGVLVSIVGRSLVVKQQEKTNLAKIQKSYTILETAVGTAVLLKGDVSKWGTSNILFLTVLKDYLKVNIDCISSNAGLCIIISNDNSKPSLQLKDGASVNANIASSTCTDASTATGESNLCGTLTIDINGTKSPNKSSGCNQGFCDQYQFEIVNDGLEIPSGSILHK